VALNLSMADLMAAAGRAGAAGAGAPQGGGEASDPGGGGGTSVFASVEKLGLKLEPAKAPVQQLVVDHAEKMPTEN
jgi:uncharacterized protein (TIGR03435 family)